MIRDGKYFDVNTYEQYINNRDYVNAAYYLKSFQWKDKLKQQKVDNAIKVYEREGRIAQSLYDKSNDKERQAMSFLSGFDSGGTLPTEKDAKGNFKNAYTRQYTKLINELGGKDTTNLLVRFNPRIEKRYSHPASIVSDLSSWLPNNWGSRFADILYKDEDMGIDGFSLFKKQIGMDEQSLKKYGINVVRDRDGNVVLDIKKNNKLMPKIVQALQHTTSNYDPKNSNTEITPGAKGNYRFALNAYADNGGKININNLISEKFGDENNNFDHNQNSLSAYAELNHINHLLEDANDNKKQLLKVAEHQYVQSSVVANYLGQEDLRAKQSNDPTLIKSVKDGYDRILMGSSFADMKVYSNVENPRAAKAESDDPGTLKYEDDVSKRVAIHNLITANINDVSYAAAMVGDKTGTMITIPEKRDKDGNKVIVPAKQIFVEGLFNSEAEETFNADSKLRATKDFATMQTYDYPYDVVDPKASNGHGRIFGADNNGAWYDNGVDQPYRIDKLQAIDLINMQHIVDDGATMLARIFSNPDGSMRNNVRFKEQLDNYTKAAVSELEPEAFKRVAEGYQRGGGKALDAQGQIDYEYYKKRQAELANFIMNGVAQQMQ